ncbi:MAG TPA: hypothetical protein VJO54_15785 [Burkholderiales bacterium]|nr:hypothetical protein [Burkholderiales bacterium]
MIANTSIEVVAAGRGITIRFCEQGLERHVWVDQPAFERFLAAGETIYEDTPAIAVEGPRIS